MKKTYPFIASVLVAALVLQGCVKEYLKPVPEDGKKQEQPVEDDDIVKLLKGVEGVSDVEKTLAAKADGSTVANYFFRYEQPVDQTDGKKGTFKQRVGMQLTDLQAPVVVHTQGYAMNMDGKTAVSEDLATFLQANWVEIEFRYFGESQPEPMEDVKMTYLYSVQAAADIHRVVTMLRENLFKDNKWVATGSSKGGTTAGLQAYYSDLNDWKDFDLYVPFCAPFLAGTAASPTDRSIGRYILTNCGFGYPEGSAEAKAYSNLHKILRQAVTKPRLRNEILRHYHLDLPGDYQQILSVYGPREDAALCGALQVCLENMLGDFAHIPFGSWAPLVPDPDPIKEGPEDDTDDDAELIENVRKFFFMNSDDMEKILNKPAEDPETKALHTAEEMREKRFSDVSMPYSVQSVRELGCAGMDYAWVPGPFLTPALAEEVQDKACGRARAWDYYEGQWDGGKLMTAFRKWVYTESTQKILFVYGTNDPWTGGAIDAAAAEANANIVLAMNPGGIHTAYFLDAASCAPETSSQIKEAITTFLNIRK